MKAYHAVLQAQLHCRAISLLSDVRHQTAQVYAFDPQFKVIVILRFVINFTFQGQLGLYR